MGAEIHRPDSAGHTPLLLAALSGATDIVRLLLGKDAPLDAQDSQGNTVMHLAARGGHVTIVELLLDYGAGILVNDSGLNCLSVAMAQNKCDVVLAMIKHDR